MRLLIVFISALFVFGGAYCQKYTRSTLDQSIVLGDVKTILKHEKNGVSINELVDFGDERIPLSFSLFFSGQHELLKSLVENGLKFPEQFEDWTPLTYAVSKNDTLLTKIILKSKPNINGKTPSGMTAISLAARDGYPEVLNLLINAGADVDIICDTGSAYGDFTPMMYAAYNGKIETIRSLLESGASIDYQNKEGYNAISLAAENNHTLTEDLLRDPDHKEELFFILKLLDHDEDLNSAILREQLKLLDIDHQFNSKWSILHYIAREGYSNLLKEIQLDSLNLNIQNKTGFSPLMLASLNNYFDLVKLFHDNGASEILENDYGQNSIEIADSMNLSVIKRYFYEPEKALEQNRLNNSLWDELLSDRPSIDEIRELIDAKADPNALNGKFNTALGIAVLNNQAEVAQFLLANKADPNVLIGNKKDYTPLILAAKYNYLNMGKILIDGGAKKDQVNSKGETAVDIAKKNGNVLFVQLLENPTSFWSNELLLTVQRSYPETWENIDSLIEHGADINVADSTGNTVLHYLVQSSPDSTLVYFLAKKPNLKLKNNKGFNAFDIAIISNSPNAVYQLLLFDPNLAPGKAVMDSLQKPHFEIISHLLRHPGADDPIQLFSAIKNGNHLLLQHILKKGVNPNIHNTNGNSALARAVFHSDTIAIQILLDAKADPMVMSRNDITPIMNSIRLNDLLTFVFLSKVLNKSSVLDDDQKLVDFARKTNSFHIINYLNKDKDYYKDYLKNKVLWDAVITNDSVLIIKALENGSSLEAFNNFGYNALHIATLKDNESAVNLLISRGADINSRTYFESYTPLMVSAAESEGMVLCSLINAGADESLKDNNGKTFLDLLQGSESAALRYRICTLTDEVTAILEEEKLIDDLKNQLLVMSSETGEIENVHDMIVRGCNLNYLDSSGFGALHYAALYDHFKIVELLLLSGADPNISSREGKLTPLMLAMREGNILSTDRLLQFADSTLLNGEGKTASFLALENNRRKLIRYLKDPKIVLDEIELYKAISENNYQLVREYLSSEFSPNYYPPEGDFWSPLNDACRYNRYAMLELMLDKKPAIDNLELSSDSMTMTPLMLAAFNNYAFVVYRLLKQGANKHVVGNHGKTALDLAKEKNSKWAVKILKDEERGFAKYLKKQGFIDALALGYDPLINELMKSDFKIEQKKSEGWTPMHYAARDNKLEVLNFLIKKGAKINCVTQEGYTPLILAAYNNQHEIIEILLRLNADIDFRDKNGETAYDIATRLQFRESVNALTSEKGRPESYLLTEAVDYIIKDDFEALNLLSIQHPEIFSLKFKNQRNLLHYAAEYGRLNISKWLMRRIPIDQVDDSLRTPLMLSARNDQVAVGYFLLKNGANEDLEDFYEIDARNYAQKKGYRLFSEMFKYPDSIYIHNEFLDNVYRFVLDDSDDYDERYNVNSSLKKIKNINFTNNFGWSALHLAVRNNNLELCIKLIQNGIDPNIKAQIDDEYLGTPIIIAAANDYLDIFHFLKGAMDPEVYQQELALIHKICTRKKSSWILKYLSRPNETLPVYQLSKELAHNILELNSQDVSSYIAEGAVIDKPISGEFFPLLMVAQREDKSDLLDVLIKNFGDINTLVPAFEGEYTALQLAALNNNISGVVKLYNAGSDPKLKNKEGFSAESFAEQQGNKSILAFFKDPEKFSLDFSLNEAVIAKNESEIKRLLASGASLATNINGTSSYKLILQQGTKDMIHLLTRNANVSDLEKEIGSNLALEFVRTQEVWNQDVIFSINKYELFPEIFSKSGNFLSEDTEGITLKSYCDQKNFKWYLNFLSDSLSTINDLQVMKAIIQKIEEKDQNKVIELFTANPTVLEYKGTNHLSWLQYALYKDLDSIARYLITQKSGLYGNNFYKNPATMLIEKNKLDLLELLLKSDFDVNYSSPLEGAEVNPLLNVAIDNSNLEAAKLVLKYGADLDLLSGYFREGFIDKVIRKDNNEMLEWLLENGATTEAPDRNNSFPIHILIDRSSDRKEALLKLIKHGVNLNSMGSEGTPLHVAAYYGRNDYIEILLNHGADPTIYFSSKDGLHTPIMTAVANNEYEATCTFVEHKVDPYHKNIFGESAISIARNNNNQQLLKFFLQREKALLDKELADAIRDSEMPDLNAIIVRGADVNHKVDNQTNMLTLALYNKNYAALEQLLLSDKIDINSVDDDGDATIHNVIRNIDTIALDLLLKYNVELNNFNKEGNSPLFISINEYNPKLTQRLLEAGADPQKRNQFGMNAFDLAKIKGLPLISRVLSDRNYLKTVTLMEDLFVIDLNVILQPDFFERCYQQLVLEFEPTTEYYVDYLRDYIFFVSNFRDPIEALNKTPELLQLTKQVYGQFSSNQEYIDALDLIVSCNNDIGNYPKALEIQKELFDLDPSSLEALLDLSRAYLNNSLDSMALKSYTKLTKSFTDKMTNLDQYIDRELYVRTLIFGIELYNYIDDSANLELTKAQLFKELTLTDSINTYAPSVGNLSSLSDALAEAGDVKMAEHYFSKGLEFAKNDSSEFNFISRLLLHLNYGNFATEQGLFKKAHAQLSQADSIITAYHISGFIYEKFIRESLKLALAENNAKSAIQRSLELNDLVRSKLSIEFALMSEDEKFYMLEEMKTNLDLVYSTGLKYSNSHPEMLNVMFSNVLLTKGLLLESSRSILAQISSTGNQQAKKSFSEWQSNQLELAKLYAQPEDERRLQPFILENRGKDLEKEMIRNANSETLEARQSLNFTLIKKMLRPNEAAIELFHFNNYNQQGKDSTIYCSLTIHPQKEQPVLNFLFNENELKSSFEGEKNRSTWDNIEDLYGNRGAKAENLTKNQSQLKLSNRFYKLIWSPIIKDLGGIQNLYISNTGLTHKIAHAAIAIDEKSLLIDKYRISIVTSTKNIIDGNESNKKKTAFLVGGIKYSVDSVSTTVKQNTLAKMSRNLTGDESTTWDYLPGTLSEVSNISGILDSQNWEFQLLTESDATEEQIKTLSSPTVLHFATHGFFFQEANVSNYDSKETRLFMKRNVLSKQESISSSKNPMFRSGLLLSGANYSWITGRSLLGREDGILTAFEVSLLDLSNTELVVLSACETGLGDIKGNEGVFGLQRAFKIAGSKYIISSLWQVPDLQTEELMSSFYTFYASGVSIEKAFYDAQLIMKSKYPPYYWAAFILVK